MLAIAGGKGGCGKTATACGLAEALVRAGHRPVVVDADVDMPDLHDRARAAPDPGLDDLASGAPVESVLQRDHDLDGVGVVASGSAAAIGPALQRLTTVQGPVIVDCPAGAGRDVTTALRCTDRAVVVTTATGSSLADATRTAAMSRTLGTPVDCLVVRDAGPPSTAGPNTRRGPHLPDEAAAAALLSHVGAAELVRLPSPEAGVSAPETRPAFDSLAGTLAFGRSVTERPAGAGDPPVGDHPVGGRPVGDGAVDDCAGRDPTVGEPRDPGGGRE
jgi:septum site-determining protein MinD